MQEGVSESAQAAPALADAAAGAAQAVPAYSWTGYFLGLALMCVMLAILWYGARFLRQKGALRFFGQTAGLSVESRLVLSPRKHLLVVKYRNKRLLLGVTEHNINLLSEDPLEDGEAPVEGDEADQAGEAGGITAKFKDMLHDLNKRK